MLSEGLIFGFSGLDFRRALPSVNKRHFFNNVVKPKREWQGRYRAQPIAGVNNMRKMLAHFLCCATKCLYICKKVFRL